MNDMKTKLVDFDIEKARNGAKVVAEYVDKDFTRPCRIVCYDAKGEFPIVALILRMRQRRKNTYNQYTRKR